MDTDKYKITVVNQISIESRFLYIDSISFEKAVIEAGYQIHNTSEHIVKAELIEDFIDEKKSNEWVSIKDKLPCNEEKDYLVVVQLPSRMEQIIGQWYFEGEESYRWMVDVGFNIPYEVTHWKELDELPIIN